MDENVAKREAKLEKAAAERQAELELAAAEKSLTQRGGSATTNSGFGNGGNGGNFRHHRGGKYFPTKRFM